MASEIRIGRRRFLVSSGIAGLHLSLIGPLGVIAAAAQPAAEADAFLTVSRFLTGAGDLNPDLAARALSQLVFLDEGFSGRVAALAAAIEASGAADVDAFLDTPAAGDADRIATMVTIVSAWYLGYTGTPVSLRAEDDTGFVTFTEARIYGPTMDATVRPTYARGGTDYWIDPPSFVTPPPAPPGIREWGAASPQGIGAIPVAASPPPEVPPPTEPAPAPPTAPPPPPSPEPPEGTTP